MKLWKVAGIAIGTLLASLAGQASAQNCSDILVNGTMGSTKWSEKSYYQNLVYARFASLDYATSKTDTSLTGSVAIGQYVMGSLNYSQAQFDERKQQIVDVRFSQQTSSRELDVALTSGDQAVIQAWTSCIQGRGGGLTMRFKPITPNLATLTIEYFAGPGQSSATLGDDILVLSATGGVDEVKVVGGAGCLSKGRTYLNKTPCDATLQINSAQTAVVATGTVETGTGTTAVLQPRMRPAAAERMPYAFNVDCRRDQLPSNVGAAGVGPQVAAWRARCADRLYSDTLRNGPDRPRWNADLTPDQIKEGWRFDPSTAGVTVNPIYGDGHRGNYCRAQESAVSPERFSYGIELYSGPTANASMVCYVEPSIMLVRDRWVPGV